MVTATQTERIQIPVDHLLRLYKLYLNLFVKKIIEKFVSKMPVSRPTSLVAASILTFSSSR